MKKPFSHHSFKVLKELNYDSAIVPEKNRVYLKCICQCSHFLPDPFTLCSTVIWHSLSSLRQKNSGLSGYFYLTPLSSSSFLHMAFFPWHLWKSLWLFPFTLNCSLLSRIPFKYWYLNRLWYFDFLFYSMDDLIYVGVAATIYVPLLFKSMSLACSSLEFQTKSSPACCLL